MSKIILFEKSYYDYTGNYRCYDIDEKISKEYVLLYDNPVDSIEINSVLNINTNYYVTLMNISKKYIESKNRYRHDDKFIHLKYDMPDIKKDVQFFNRPIITQFSRVVLSIRTLNLHSFNSLQSETYLIIDSIDNSDEFIDDEPDIIPIQSIENYTKEYKSEGEESFIRDYIEQGNCELLPDFQDCTTLRDKRQSVYDTLTSESSKCDTASVRSLPEIRLKHDLIEKELRLKIIKLSDENKKLNETWSNSEYFIGVLFVLGSVMFLYTVYLSLQFVVKKINF